MGIVLAGKGKMLAKMIESCVKSGIKISGVLRYETVHFPLLKRLFNEIFLNCPDKILIDRYKLNDIRVKSINSPKFKDFLIKNNVGILVIGTWGEKVKKEISDTPALACVNIHPSLLPKYRGPNPYLEVILNDEKETGVTFHLINENYDTGNILAQEKITVDESDTSEDLRNKTIFKAGQMLPKVIGDIQNGLIIPVKQNEALASYYPLRKFDNIINFKVQTASEIIRQARALHPWIPCYIELKSGLFFKINPRKVKETDFSKDYCAGMIIDKDAKTKSLTIVCKDGKAIEMSDLKLYPEAFSIFSYFAIKCVKLNS